MSSTFGFHNQETRCAKCSTKTVVFLKEAGKVELEILPHSQTFGDELQKWSLLRFMFSNKGHGMDL